MATTENGESEVEKKSQGCMSTKRTENLIDVLFNFWNNTPAGQTIQQDVAIEASTRSPILHEFNNLIESLFDFWRNSTDQDLPRGVCKDRLLQELTHCNNPEASVARLESELRSWQELKSYLSDTNNNRLLNQDAVIVDITNQNDLLTNAGDGNNPFYKTTSRPAPPIKKKTRGPVVPLAKRRYSNVKTPQKDNGPTLTRRRRQLTGSLLQNPFKYPFCKYSGCKVGFYQEKELRTHYKKKHNLDFDGSPLPRSYLEISSHLAMVRREDLLGEKGSTRCALCRAQFRTEAEVLTHQSEAHVPDSFKAYACCQCGKKFVMESSIQSHNCGDQREQVVEQEGSK